MAIKEPTFVDFRPHSGSNLLIVGQNEEAALGVVTSAVISLAAQMPAALASPSIFILDGSPAGSTQAASLAALTKLAGAAARMAAWRELPAVVNELAAEVERRIAAPEGVFAPLFVLVYGLHKLRDLRRQEDEFSFSRSGENRPPDPGKQFTAVLRDGPPVGVHALVWCDSLNNLQRAWDRQTLREFELRAVFQMSSNDSSTLIDSPTAAKLGLRRGLLHSEEQGVMEKFRPYRWPEEAWLEWVRGRLA